MTKKQVFILLAVICFISVTIGLISFFTDDSGWLGIGISFAIAYIAGGLVILDGLIKLIRILTSSKTSPKQRKWTQKRLLFIAVAAVISFAVSYLRTPH